MIVRDLCMYVHEHVIVHVHVIVPCTCTFVRHTCTYSGTSLIRTPLGQKKVSLLVRCPDFQGV